MLAHDDFCSYSKFDKTMAAAFDKTVAIRRFHETTVPSIEKNLGQKLFRLLTKWTFVFSIDAVAYEIEEHIR